MFKHLDPTQINFELGDVIFADLGPQRNRCLAGVRPCVFLSQTNFSTQIIPITGLFKKNETQKQIFGSDVIAKKGIGNLTQDSIIRVHECKSIDVTDIQFKTGKLPKEVIKLLLEKYHSLLN